MFSSTTFDHTGFDSVSEVSKKTVDANLQTNDVIVKDSGQQSNDVHDKSIQCEPPVEDKKVDYDEQKLLQFLNKVTVPLFKELDKIERSKAFTVQKIDNGFDGEEVEELHVLDGEPKPTLPNPKISCLSWSCTGNVVAISYENAPHEGWCTHESLVNFYNISSYKFDGKVTSHSIRTDSCITGIAMHPFEPSIVALATYSGNVEIWSVGKENRNDGVCLTKEQYHEDKITQICWAIDSCQSLILATSSLDGRMCILKNSSIIGSTELIEKYVLDPTSPDVLKPGVTCFSFCQKQPGTFVAALENGQLLLCSTFGSKSNMNVVEKSPVLRMLDKRKGFVTYVKFSPHESYLFLVASLDFKIILYSIQQDAPICEIFSDFDIVGADWSPTDVKTLIAWGTSPKLYIYNQDTGKRIGELIPSNNSASINGRYNKVLFNPKSPKLMALAETNGSARIWSIPCLLRGQS